MKIQTNLIKRAHNTPSHSQLAA